ncbi:MAG: Holliday junction branch migration DNA helicase RuvB [Dehalococcoidia bacterium]
MAEARIVSGNDQPEDSDSSLRPRRLADYIGQEKVKDNLHIGIKAALARGEPLDHMLLYGPPGLGKTTLANIIASEMQVNVRTTSGPAIERPGDIASVLTNLQAGDVFFVDEIHRLPRIVEEVLYSAMEDFALDIVIGKGPGARSVRIPLAHFSLVGATTRYDMISPPLRDRFGSVYRLDFYTHEALTQIVTRSARILAVPTDPAGAVEIARRSRGTPRIANRLLRRVRDHAQVLHDGVITLPVAKEALARLEVDDLGLDEVDRLILRKLIETNDGGPVGLSTLAHSTSEDQDTIETVYEPFLLRLGFINRTPRGRMATRKAYLHLGLTPPAPERPDSQQGSLFEDEPES